MSLFLTPFYSENNNNTDSDRELDQMGWMDGWMERDHLKFFFSHIFVPFCVFPPLFFSLYFSVTLFPPLFFFYSLLLPSPPSNSLVPVFLLSLFLFSLFSSPPLGIYQILNKHRTPRRGFEGEVAVH